MPLKNKIALVLGASRGLGRSMALTLAKQGASLAVPYYDWPESVAEMQQQFQKNDYDHLAMKVDLRQEGQVAEMMEQIKGKYGRLDILVNNIERGGMPVVHGPYTPEQWELEMTTTLQAKWNVFQHALPLLRQQTEAVAVTISSIAAITGRSGPAGLIFNDGYAAANRAVSAFTETWARQGAPKVRVNEIMLGFFEYRHAQKTRGWPLLSPEQQQQIIDHTLLGRTGLAKDLSKALLFIIKDAPFMTGSCLRLDGGYVLGGEQIPAMPTGLQENLAVKL